MASTKALLRLSSLPRTTASKCVLSVVARRLNESSRLRRAHDSQAFRSALARSAWLSWARRSRLDSFKRLATTLKTHFDAVVRGSMPFHVELDFPPDGQSGRRTGAALLQTETAANE